MTFKEYYSQHLGDWSFFSADNVRQAVTLPEATAYFIATSLNNKVLALASGLQFEPVWAFNDDQTIKDAETVYFLKQYPISQFVTLNIEGFHEAEREINNNTNQVVYDGSNTGSSSTFKSFPQVTGAELASSNKVGETSESDTNTSTTNESGYNSREVIRTYNTAEQTEKLATFMADMLTRIAKDYIKLTAVDGVYSAPEGIDD